MTGCNDYFRTFCMVSKALGTTLGMQEVLDLIVQSSIDTMVGKAACLFLADEEKDVFESVAQRGLSESYLHARPMPAKKVVDEILQGGYLSIYDATTDPRVENHDEKKAEGVASILVVPVMVGGKAIGVLSLYTSEPRDFTTDEIEFQSALAEQGGMAIQKAGLIERIQKNAELFYYLSSSINSSLDIEKILHILTAELADTLGTEGVSIRLLERDTGELNLVAAYGLSEEYRRRTAPKDACMEMALRGETVIIEDVASDERVGNRPAILKEGIVSALCMPIKSRGEVIGVMRLGSSVKRQFSRDMVQLVQAVADQGGLAIENSRQFDRIKRNSELFFELASSVNAGLDIRKILHILTSEVADAFDLKGVDIRLWDKDRRRLELAAAYALSEAYLNKGFILSDKAFEMVLHGETVLLADITEYNDLQRKDAALAEGIASMLVLPIKAGDEVIGTMCLASAVKNAFPDDTIQLLRAVALQGGLAIQNASMYLMLQEDKKSLEQDIWLHKTWF